MELALNLLWILLSVVALRLWVLRARESNEARGDVLRGVIVLSCVLLLLFPTISITDDLHASSELVEDWTFARKSKIWASQFAGDSGIHQVGHVAAVCFGAQATPTLWRCGWVESSDEVAPHHTSAAARFGRAPPTAVV